MNRIGLTPHIEELAAIPLPKETRSYKPVSHQALAIMLSTIASDLLPEFELVNMQFGLARDGAQMLGFTRLRMATLQWAYPLDSGIAMIKVYPLG